MLRQAYQADSITHGVHSPPTLGSGLAVVCEAQHQNEAQGNVWFIPGAPIAPHSTEFLLCGRLLPRWQWKLHFRRAEFHRAESPAICTLALALALALALTLALLTLLPSTLPQLRSAHLDVRAALLCRLQPEVVFDKLHGMCGAVCMLPGLQAHLGLSQSPIWALLQSQRAPSRQSRSRPGRARAAGPGSCP